MAPDAAALVLDATVGMMLDVSPPTRNATIKKPLLNRFRDHIVEGQVYRATSHEFKLVFLHRTTVVAVDEDVIPKTYFNMFSFSELLNMTQDYDFLVDVIGLLTSVGEEKEYAKEEKIVKIIVLELTSKEYCDVHCLGTVNQVNHFLASGYVEQPVVVIQLAKVKFFRGTFMIEQGVNSFQPLFIANEGKVVFLEDDFMRLTRKYTIEELQDNNELHITNVTPRFKIKITLEDHCGECIFLLFDREASYLLKKSCADLFTEFICGDTYPPIFQGFTGKKLLLKVDTKRVTHDTFYGTFRIRRICDDPNIIAMFELPDYDADDESTPKKPAVSGGTEFAALINGEDVKDEKISSNDTLIHENHVVTSKGKRNLNPQFEEAATDADGQG
ncbi:hypothetical protein Ahy_B01g051606 [Arachis hypogaea]|uniref:DUF223 domain-containing protein n=1 Tax=Arachis hypogaea TaxID=3818 RepID=A0A445AMM0_ARAHY|nr:hypothetical protein Ahy_B01g051606 [Arachis hypogaea]